MTEMEYYQFYVRIYDILINKYFSVIFKFDSIYE